MKCFNINARPADIYSETLHMVLVCILMVSIMTWRQLPKSYHRWCALFWKLSYSDLKWTIGAWLILPFNCKTKKDAAMHDCLCIHSFHVSSKIGWSKLSIMTNIIWNDHFMKFMMQELLKQFIFMRFLIFLIFFSLMFLFICKHEQSFRQEKNLPKPGKSKKMRTCLGKIIGICQLRGWTRSS